MAYITIAVLVAAILIGYFTNVNTGLIGILLAFVTGYFFVGMSAKEIIAGFPYSTCFTLMGVTFFFGAARVNGTLNNVASAFAKLARGNTKLIPIIFFFIGLVLSAVGPGPVPMTAILVPIAMSVADKEDIPDVLMAVSVIFGTLAGGLTQITSSGVIAYTLGTEQGVANYMPVFLACLIVSTIQFIVFYLVLGGLKLKNHEKAEASEKIVFDKNQWITLAMIIVVIACVLIFGMDTGLMTFCGGALLLIFNIADQKKTIEIISWNTILLILGMAILINVVKVAGGIDAMTTGLSAIMTAKTAAPIMCVIAGLMSAVSSASGVVMPTLIPTIGTLSESLGNVSTTALLAAIVVGAHAVTASPLSTLGALSMAASNEKTNKQKMFTQLMIIGFGSIVFAAVIGALGVFYIGG